jgi:hypothetical protein
MPKLKTVLPNLDDLDSSLHDFYVEQKIKTAKGEITAFVLDQEGVDEHPNVIALKNALDRQKEDRRKAIEERDAFKARLAAIPEDFDPEAYETLKNELESLKGEGKTIKPDEKQMAELTQARKNLEQKIAKMEKDHATAIAKKDEDIKKRDGTIQTLLIDDGLTKALIESGVSKDYLKAAKALLRSDCVVIEEDDKYKAVVKSDLGELEIGKFVSDWVAGDEGKVFVPPAKGADSGTGVTKKNTSTDKNPWADDSLNLTEQGKIIKEDRSKAERLAKAAGKKLSPAM